MVANKRIFFNTLAQTSPSPPALQVNRAEGVYIYGVRNKKYMDLISGISVSNLGHGNKKTVNAIKRQLTKHSYLMVYGEYIVNTQTEYAALLTRYLPKKLNNVYFVNSGSEAIEGALKLAKRFTGRTEIISFKNGYHGSTHGALSIMGNESMKQAFRPLLPDVRFLKFNNRNDLQQITSSTACVIIEPIQGEAGVIIPKYFEKENFLQLLRKRCNETGALLILDEIQTGMGRTGKLFAFEHYKVIPDILCLAKAFGGGMPLGAFISSKEIMASLSVNPVLGHITTFGGHPISCAAGKAALQEIVSRKLHLTATKKEKLFRKLLSHPKILVIRGKGLLLALQFKNEEINKNVIAECMSEGILTDWFLFRSDAMRLAPPLTISESEIKSACKIINHCINKATP